MTIKSGDYVRVTNSRGSYTGIASNPVDHGYVITCQCCFYGRYEPKENVSKCDNISSHPQ